MILNHQKESIMTEEKKTIDSEVLEKVDGGWLPSAF